MENTPANPHVIICNGFGSYSVFPATVETAYAIFNDRVENLYSEFKVKAEAYSSKSAKFVLSKTLACALVEVLNSNKEFDRSKVADRLASRKGYLRNLYYGFAKKDVEDTRPEVNILPEWRAELCSWIVDNNLEANKLESNISAYFCTKHMPIECLSFLKHLMIQKDGSLTQVQVIDDSELDSILDYLAIVDKKWKAEAKPERVIARILEFVNNMLTHRDEKFEIVAVKDYS